jgi:hypothetical protein
MMTVAKEVQVASSGVAEVLGARVNDLPSNSVGLVLAALLKDWYFVAIMALAVASELAYPFMPAFEFGLEPVFDYVTLALLPISQARYVAKNRNFKKFTIFVLAFVWTVRNDVCHGALLPPLGVCRDKDTQKGRLPPPLLLTKTIYFYSQKSSNSDGGI